jgi:hypothetical protein
MQGDALAVTASGWSAFRQAQPAVGGPGTTRRRVADLLTAAERHREARERREAAEAAEKARQEAEARRTYLHGLIGKEEWLWQKAEKAIGTPADYDAAMQVICDLYELADLTGDKAGFAHHYVVLKKRYSRKWGIWRRLQEAGVRI